MNPTDTNTDDVPADADAAVGEEPKPKLSLEVKVDQPSACQRHVTVTVAREDIDRYFSEKFDELMPDAEVPGFRKGRAPRKLVESKFRHTVSDQVKGSLLMDSISQATEECDFSAISEPDFKFEAITVPDEGPMTYEFDIEVRPEFDMPKWQGLKIDKPVKNFTEKDVDHHLKYLLSRYGDLVPHDGAAEKGDHVTVNATFRHGGKVISKLEEETLHILPKLSFPDATIDGFDDLMDGAAASDKKQTKTKLSADAYNEELRGQEVEVEFEVLDVKRLEIPKLDGEMLGKIGDFENEEGLRAAVRNELERQLMHHQNRVAREQITETLTATASFDLPPDMLKRQARRELDRMVMELQSSGFSKEQIRAYENDLRQNSLRSTETALKEHFVLERIAEEQKVEDDPADYDREISMIALQQGESPRKVRARLEKRGLMDTLRNQIIERKVINLITAEAKFKETEFTMPENDTAAVDHAIGGAPKDTDIPDAKPEGVAESLPEMVDHS